MKKNRLNIIFFALSNSFLLFLFIHVLKLNSYLSVTLSYLFSFFISNFIAKEKIFSKKKLLLFIICLFTYINIFRNELFYDTYSSYKVLIIIVLYGTIMYSFFYQVLFNFSSFKKLIKKIDEKWGKVVKFKYLKPIFKCLPQNFFVFVLFIISIITILFYNNSGIDYYEVYSSKQDNNLGPITEKTELNIDKIEFDKKVNKMCFKVGTFNRKNSSKYIFEIKEKDKLILKKIINSSILNDGENYCFNINENAKKLNDYNFYITPTKDISADNSITFFSDNKSGNVSVSLLKWQSNNLTIIKTLMIITSTIIFLVVNYIINTKKLSVNKFLLLTLSFIIPILFIIPPLSVPDEVYHFYKSYGLSEVKFNSNIGTELSNHNLIVPKNIKCIDYSNIGNYNKIQNINDISKCFKENNNKKMYNHHIDNNAVLGYIPQAVGIKVGDFFTNNPVIIFYFGRIFSLLFSFLITYFAIKITPKYKNLFLVVSTMMMYVQQMVSYSYDSILHAVCLLFVAYCLKLIYSEEKIKFKNMVIPVISFFVFLNIKPVYMPLGILLLFIPKKKFKNKLLLLLFTLIISLVIWKGFSLLLNIGYKPVISSSPDGLKQLKYIINNPFDLFMIAVNTYKNYFIFYLEGLTGYFGWFAFRVDRIYILIYFLLFLYVFLSEKSDLKLTNKIALFLCNCIIIVGVFAAMYLFWSDYKLGFVEGVQGRYFIPLLIPIILSVLPKKSYIKINQNILYGTISVLLLQMLIILILGYY